MPASWDKALDAPRPARSRRPATARPRWPAARRPTRRPSSCSRCCATTSARATSAPRTGAEQPLDVAARAGRPEAAGERAGPRVRAHRPAGRLRPDRRGAGLGPAHPQGRAPPRHQGRHRLRPPDRAGPDRRDVAALRARRRRGLPGRARRRAVRRRRQPRRRGQLRRHQRDRDPRVRRRAARRRRGGRDRLRRARAGGQRRPRAAQRRLAAEPRHESRAAACSRCRARRTAAACARPASRPATARATRRSPLPAATPSASPRARLRRAAHGLAAPRRPAAHLPEPPALGARARHRADRDRRRVADERHDARVRRRRLPRRGLPREGRHARASRRAPAAPAARRSAVRAPRAAQPGLGVRPLWQVITDVARQLGSRPATSAPARRSRAACSRRPVLRGDHARGDRRPRRALGRARRVRLARLGAREARDPARRAPAPADGKLRLGTYRPLWAAKEVDISPVLHFIRARQVAELSPVDADALGIDEGDQVEVGNGTPACRANVRAARRRPGRQRVPRRGHARGQRERADRAAWSRSHRVGAGLDRRRPPSPPRSQPAVEGLAEMPPSAPLPIPPREVT